MRLAAFFERVIQAMQYSREREAERVIRRHAHFLIQADAYERDRVGAEAHATAEANPIAEAKATMAQGGLQLAPRILR
jgi:hypothetical protein